MIVYIMSAENYNSIESGAYTSFGIKAIEKSGEKEKCVCHVKDVFANEKKARAFIEKINRLGLDRIHLPDAVIDEIS